MVILNQSNNRMQNYATWTQIALLNILRIKMFLKTLQIILKKYLTHQIMSQHKLLSKDKNKNVIGLMKKCYWTNEKMLLD